MDLTIEGPGLKTLLFNSTIIYFIKKDDYERFTYIPG